MALSSQEDNSDWEYEYDDTETESYYVVLDLSSAATMSNTQKLTSKWQATASKSTSATPAPDTMDPDAEVDKNNTTVTQEEDCIQMLNLHSLNPLISYRDQVYSCRWSSTIGTDILLTKPGPRPEHAMSKQPRGYNILGISNIKLVGCPSQLVLNKERPALQLTQEANPGIEPIEKNNATAAALFNISRDPQSSIDRQAQAHFLERLIAAKRARGETDSVTIGIAKYEGEGSLGREGRNLLGEWPSDEHIETEVGDRPATMVKARGGRVPSRATPKVAGRTRMGYTIGRPKRDHLPGSDRRREIGGFFRDYRPSLGEVEMAEIGKATDSTSTPKSWNDVGGFAGASPPKNEVNPNSPALTNVSSLAEVISRNSDTVADRTVSAKDVTMIDG